MATFLQRIKDSSFAEFRISGLEAATRNAMRWARAGTFVQIGPLLIRAVVGPEGDRAAHRACAPVRSFRRPAKRATPAIRAALRPFPTAFYSEGAPEGALKSEIGRPARNVPYFTASPDSYRPVKSQRGRFCAFRTP